MAEFEYKGQSYEFPDDWSDDQALAAIRKDQGEEVPTAPTPEPPQEASVQPSRLGSLGKYYSEDIPAALGGIKKSLDKSVENIEGPTATAEGLGLKEGTLAANIAGAPERVGKLGLAVGKTALVDLPMAFLGLGARGIQRTAEAVLPGISTGAKQSLGAGVDLASSLARRLPQSVTVDETTIPTKELVRPLAGAIPAYREYKESLPPGQRSAIEAGEVGAEVLTSLGGLGAAKKAAPLAGEIAVGGPTSLVKGTGRNLAEAGKKWSLGDLKITKTTAKTAYGKTLEDQKKGIAETIYQHGLTKGKIADNVEAAELKAGEFFSEADRRGIEIATAPNAPTFRPEEIMTRGIDTKLADVDLKPQVTKIVDDVMKGLRSEGLVGEVTLDKLIAAKQSLNRSGKLFKNAIGQSDSDALRQAVKKKMYLNIVDEIGEKFPDIKALNTEGKKLLDAHAALDGAAARLANRDAVSLTDWMFGTGGAAVAMMNPGTLAVTAPLLLTKMATKGGRVPNIMMNVGRALSSTPVKTLEDVAPRVERTFPEVPARDPRVTIPALRRETDPQTRVLLGKILGTEKPPLRIEYKPTIEQAGRVGEDPRTLNLIEKYPLEKSPGGLTLGQRKPSTLSSLLGNERGAVGGTSPEWYSPVGNAVSALKQERGTGDQMFAMITKTPGVKESEWKWMGLDDFLKGKNSVTKQEIEDFVRNNKVELSETVLGGDKISWKKTSPKIWYAEGIDATITLMGDGKYLLETPKTEITATTLERAMELGKDVGEVTGKGNTKYSQYTLPGGKNYREVLLTLPDRGKELAQQRYKDAVARGVPLIDAMEQSGGTAPFKSSHWDEPNVIAHVRMNDRTGPNGEKVLFVEEIQSDWAREARVKGVKTGAYEKGQASFLNWEKENPGKNPQIWRDAHPEWAGVAKTEEAGVPNSPFLKNWEELTLKKIIREAAEKGYDRVAWINGQQTADRYDLSKHISEVAYWKDGDKYGISLLDPNGRPIDGFNPIEGLSAKEVENTLGKDLANKIVNDGGSKSDEISGFAENGKLPEGVSVIRGVENLKIGGEWANNLYDVKIPQFLEKYGKKWGTKVETTYIPDVGTQQSIRITPQMRQEVMEKGQPYGRAAIGTLAATAGLSGAGLTAVAAMKSKDNRKGKK